MGNRAEIGTLWIGPELSWLERLSIASFQDKGHAVTVFHAGDAVPEVPEGVTLTPAEDIWPGIQPRLGKLPPAVLSDIFRIHLIRKTEMIWADLDVVCLKPLKPKDGYLVGWQEGTWVNGAVLRMPKGSAALKMLIGAFGNGESVFPWLDDAAQDAVRAVNPPKRQATTVQQRTNAFGPMAQTYALNSSGEIDHVLPMEVLNPIPWWLGDLYFDPRGTLDNWVTPDTQCLHLYGSRLRQIHLRRGPWKGSPLARIARKIGFDAFGGSG